VDTCNAPCRNAPIYVQKSLGEQLSPQWWVKTELGADMSEVSKLFQGFIHEFMYSVHTPSRFTCMYMCKWTVKLKLGLDILSVHSFL
jgi:hypothetical protein